jgi:hypothetical protein
MVIVSLFLVGREIREWVFFMGGRLIGRLIVCIVVVVRI